MRLNSDILLKLKWILSCVIALFLYSIAIDLNLSAAQQQSAKPLARQSAKTNAAPAEPIIVEIPKSVFIWNPKEKGYGRDPFFPIKPSEKPVIQPNEQPATSTNLTKVEEKKPETSQKPVVDLKLQGIAGGVKCIINGKPIDVGGEELVPYSRGKIRIKCNKIDGDTAFITIFYDDGSTEEKSLSLIRAQK